MHAQASIPKNAAVAGVEAWLQEQRDHEHERMRDAMAHLEALNALPDQGSDVGQARLARLEDSLGAIITDAQRRSSEYHVLRGVARALAST